MRTHAKPTSMAATFAPGGTKVSSLRASLIIAGRDARQLRSEPNVVISMFGIPIALMAVFARIGAKSLPPDVVRKYGGSGSAIVLVGLAVMFSFFVLTFVAMMIFREYAYGTWNRLRRSPISNASIIVGKMLVPIGLVLAQYMFLMSIGALFLRLDLHGTVDALLMVILPSVICIVGLGVLLTAVCRTAQQMTAYGNALQLSLGLLGGAFVPFELLPHWAQVVGRWVPTYWTVIGMRKALLEGAPVSQIAGPSAVLFMFAVVIAVAAVRLFHVDRPKTF